MASNASNPLIRPIYARIPFTEVRSGHLLGLRLASDFPSLISDYAGRGDKRSNYVKMARGFKGMLLQYALIEIQDESEEEVVYQTYARLPHKIKAFLVEKMIEKWPELKKFTGTWVLDCLGSNWLLSKKSNRTARMRQIGISCKFCYSSLSAS